MEITIDARAKALIFDIDGTLVDTMPIHYSAWREVGRSHGFEFTHEMYLKYGGVPTKTIAMSINECLGLDLDPEMVFQEKNTAYVRMINQIRLIKPVVEIVYRYTGKIPMALGTGEVPEIANLNLQAAGLGQYFDLIVTANDVTHPKPDPETFLKCAALLDVPPEFCQVFEDSVQGLEAARRAGMIVTDVRPYNGT
jgi:beta-phosphoglucomutase family hydrolase